MKNKVKIALMERSMSQKELSKQMGISPSYLQDLISGRRSSSERIRQLEHILKIDLSEYIDISKE